MSKTTRIIIAVVAVIAVIIIAIFGAKSLSKQENNEGTKLGAITSKEDLENLVKKIYEGAGKDLLPALETTAVEVSEDDIVAMYTGLQDGTDLEYLVISQPLMSAQAYELAVAKVKNGVNSNEIAKKMSENVDMRRWICVEAEKLYATNSGDIVLLIMADEENAKAVYDSFKSLAGNVGQEYEREAEIIELEPDMY